MRDIRFRAWYKPLKRMIISENIESINFETKVLGVYTTIEGKGFHKLRMSDFELMEFTGLRDKYGVEGYHKDLWRFHGVVYTIEWDEEKTCFYLKHPSLRATIDDHISMDQLPEGEMIGNVYEHPELIDSTR